MVFSDKAPDSTLLDAHSHAVRRVLRSFGRQPRHVSISLGSMLLPAFDGWPMNGSFDGETSALCSVCEYLEDDLKSAFADMPGRELSHPDEFGPV